VSFPGSSQTVQPNFSVRNVLASVATTSSIPLGVSIIKQLQPMIEEVGKRVIVLRQPLSVIPNNRNVQ